jgi:methionyl-tRNA formyltransferase
MITVTFFGTHDFAVTILDALHTDPRYDVVLTITQPDKKVGRSYELQPPPVKRAALERGIRVQQPTSLLGVTPPSTDIAVVAQYGKLLPDELLSVPTHGTLNVHTSLLPKYRGASPIQSAILNGDRKTGITIMVMDAGLDTGPVLSQEQVSIDPSDTYESLSRKLAQRAGLLLCGTIEAFVTGEMRPVKQDDAQATTCTQLTRDDGRIDWRRDAQDIYNQYRALSPWPGIWTRHNGKRLKLIRVSVVDEAGSPGVCSVKNDTLYIGCGRGSLLVHELQKEGRMVMDVKQFLQGVQMDNHRLDSTTS